MFYLRKNNQFFIDGLCRQFNKDLLFLGHSFFSIKALKFMFYSVTVLYNTDVH